MTKQRRFLSNLAFLLLANLLVKPFWILGIDRTVQNQVGPEEYGPYFALLNFSFLFNILLDFGLNNFNNRAIARHDSLLERLLPNIISLKILLGAGYFLISFLAAMASGFQGDQLFILSFLLLNQILVSFILYFRSNVAALHHFRLDALLSITDRLLMILLIGFMLWGDVLPGKISIRHFVYGQTLAYFITAVFAFAALRRLRKELRLSWRLGLFKKILKLSMPFALLGLLMSIYHRMDAVMIERMLPDEGALEAGIYAASYRLLDAFNMMGFAFASILLPMFARMQKKKEDIRPLLAQSFKAMLFLAITVMVVSWFYRHEIMQLLYTAYTPYWGELYGLLILSFAGVASMYIYGSLLTGGGYLKVLNLIGISGVLVNLVLNYLLIPHFKAEGAALATVVTQSVVALAHLIAAAYVFRLRATGVMPPVILLFALLAMAEGYLSTLLPFSWIFQILAAGAAMLITGFLLRMVDVVNELKATN
jgi:O-antigen/teichoic acid export membrane protein